MWQWSIRVVVPAPKGVEVAREDPDIDVLGFVASAVYASDEGGIVDQCRVRHPIPQLRLPHVPVRVDEAGRDEVVRSVDDGVDRCGVGVHADPD